MMTVTQMTWTIWYTVAANGWESTRQILAETEAEALELFCEYWTRDGSELGELSSYDVLGGPMSIES